MKKIVLLTLLVLSLVFTGCSTTQLEFWAANQASADWKASKVDMNMSFTQEAEGYLDTIAIQLKGFTNTEDVSGHLQLSVTDSSGEAMIDALDMYIKEGNTYMGVDYLKALAEIEGVEFPEDFIEEGIEFITFTEVKQQAALVQEFMQNQKLTEEVLKLYEDLAVLIGLDIPVEKVGNTYTVKMDQQALINSVKLIIFEGTEHLSEINKRLELGFTEEEIVELQAQVALLQPEIEDLCNLVGLMFEGNLILEMTFEEGKVTQNMKLQVVDSLLTGSTITVEANSIVEEMDPQAVNVPGKVQEISQAEYMEALMGTMIMIDPVGQIMIDDAYNELPCTTIEKDGQTYVECKTVLAAFGQEVIYDTALKTVGIKNDTAFIPLNVVTEKGTSYISLEELGNIGYYVEESPYYILIQE